MHRGATLVTRAFSAALRTPARKYFVPMASANPYQTHIPGFFSQSVAESDPELNVSLTQEISRLRHSIELIASEVRGYRSTSMLFYSLNLAVLRTWSPRPCSRRRALS